MINDRISKVKGKNYSAWYVAFPNLLDNIVLGNRIITDNTAADALTSHRAAYGPFKSLDEFFFWALDDRRLPLGQLVKYIEHTLAEPTC